MPRIDPQLMSHKLSVHPGSRPIQQRRCKLGTERAQVVEEQVQALLEADFIREVKYPAWLANVVLVKKQNGKWRMCVDYTDLNKACPKDPYPLPSIDTLVDASSGYHYLSFIDAYSGYNQIPLYKPDEEKTSLITPRANYYYVNTPEIKRKSTTWELYVDGSSNKVGSGAGIILVSKGETQIEVSLKFKFPASNNQAEYEALIIGLKLAEEVGATKVMIFSDSQVVTSQINEAYQAKDPNMKRYLDKTLEHLRRFEETEISMDTPIRSGYGVFITRDGDGTRTGTDYGWRDGGHVSAP
nr:uncharacterized protein LOC112724189 [Arachis hypogaea]